MTRPWHSLQFRLLSLCILGGLIPALLMSAYFAHEQRQEVVRAELARITFWADTFTEGERRLLQNAQLLLKILAQLDLLRQTPIDAGGCMQILRQVLAAKPEYVNLGLADARGEVVCSALPKPRFVSISDRSYFWQTLQRKHWTIGDYQVGHISGRPSLNIGYPVTLGSGEGVIYAALDLERLLADWARKMSLPIQAQVIVTDRQARILASYPALPGRIGQLLESAAPMRKAALAHPGLHERTLADGTRWLYVTKSISLPDGGTSPVSAKLYLQLPRAVVYAPFKALLIRQIVIFCLFSLLLLLGLRWAVDLMILRGVRRLLRASHAFAAGDYSARTGLKASQGEIGLLGQTFDAMGEALLTRVQESRRQRRQIARQNRIHAMLSGINNSIVRVNNPDVLLTEACRIAIEQGQFPLVWIGLLDTSGRTFVRIWSQTRVNDAQALVPAIGSAPMSIEGVKQGDQLLCNDLAQAPREQGWPPQAQGCGFKAAVMLPLVRAHVTLGIMTLYSQEEGGFDEAELLLLKEVAEDIAFALHYLEQLDRLDYLVFHEPVTGLATERVLQDRLSQRLAQLRRHEGMAAVLVIAFERLAQIAASRGRYVRDQLLCEAAQRLQRRLPARDSLASTPQGELLVMLDDPQDEQEVIDVVQELLELMQQPIRIEAHEYVLVCRIGVSLAPADGVDAERVIRNAHSVLEDLRREGKESFRFFKPEIQARIQHNLQLEQAMRKALDREEFSLVYQPIVDLRSGRLIAMEALLRWQSAELGCLPPAQFIPLAEETGLIEPLGLWVLASVCRQLTTWRAQGLALVQTSVNVSARQLHQPDFASQVTALLTRSQLDTDDIQIGLEITETALLEDLARTLATVHALREANVHIYLDDFGTGYSSLSYLQQLPVDRIKADLSFVRDLPCSAASAAVISAIVAMAHSLGLKVIAEGVETQLQRDRLIELGCDYAQGYYFAKPLPAAAMREWLAPSA